MQFGCPFEKGPVNETRIRLKSQAELGGDVNENIVSGVMVRIAVLCENHLLWFHDAFACFW
jgi:hypothetical protein